MLRRWLVMGFGVANLGLVLAGGYAWAARPDTYQEAVGEILAQHHIAYTELEVHEICLPDPDCIISDGTRIFVAVVVHGSATSAGQITCYDRRGDCYLYLPSLGMQRAPLRDLRSVRWMPKQVVHKVARMVGSLRAAVRRE